MTRQERDNLLDLHRVAVAMRGTAQVGYTSFRAAHAADKAFTDALMAVAVTQ